MPPLQNVAVSASPTPFRIALACAILRTKPVEVTTLDFMNTLRASLCRPPSHTPYADKAYLNAVAYWRAQFESSEAKRSSLLAEKVDLERKLENADVRSTPPRIDESTGKRKQGEQKDEGVPLRTAKRPRRDVRPSLEHALETSTAMDGATEDVASEFSLLKGVPNTSDLVSYLYQIHRSIQAGKDDDEGLVTGIIQLSNSLSGLVEAHDTPKSDFARMLPAVGRAYNALLYAITRIDQPHARSHCHGPVVYAVVQSFAALLDLLSRMCLRHVSREPNLTKKAVAAAHQAPQPPNKGDSKSFLVTAPKLLTNLVLSLMHTDILLPSDNVHRSIFEGLAYLVLEQSASRLSTLVLGRQTDDAGLQIPMLNSSVDAAKERSAFSHEVLWLGKLVERVVKLAPYYLSSSNVRKQGRKRDARLATSGPDATSTRTSGQGDLHQLVKDKLQATLIGCMFASDNERDDEFLERLRMPPKVNMPEPRRSVEEKEMMDQHPVEWFKDKLWRSIGWDMLLREDGW